MRMGIPARRVFIGFAVLWMAGLFAIAGLAAPVSLVDFGNVPVGTSTTRTVNMTLAASPVPRTFYWTDRINFQFGIASCDASKINCSMPVTFSPRTPGLHQNAIVVRDDWGNLLARVYVSGIGEGPQASFVPGVLSTPGPIGLLDGLAIDPQGNVYVAEGHMRTVRRIDASNGSMTTVAGIEYSNWPPIDGVRATQSTVTAAGLALDPAGDLYIAAGTAIRKVDFRTGLISRVAGTYTAGYSGDGGPATEARLNGASQIVVDKAGNLYFSDTSNHAIRRVDGDTGIITTVAGNGTGGYTGDNGPGTNAQLQSPHGLAFDVSGNLYIADTDNHRIRKLDTQTNIISTVAGNGTPGYSGDGSLAVNAQINAPMAVAVDAAGNLYIGVFQAGAIREVEATSQIIRTAAGGVNADLDYWRDGHPSTNANLVAIQTLALDAAHNLYLGTYGGGLLKVTSAPALLAFSSTFSGMESTESVRLTNTGNQPLQISRMYFSGENAGDFRLSSDCGASVMPGAGCSLSVTFAPQLPGRRSAQLVVEDNTQETCRRIDVSGIGAGPLPLSQDFGEAPTNGAEPRDQTLTLEIPGRVKDLSVGVENGSEFSLLSATCNAGRATTTCTAVVRFQPKDAGIRRDALTARDNAGNLRAETYVYGSGKSGRLMVTPGELTYPTINTGYYYMPTNLAFDVAGNLYISNGYNNTVLRVDAGTAIAKTIAGNGGVDRGSIPDGGAATQAVLSQPRGLAVNAAGDLFIADFTRHEVRKVDQRTGIISTMAGARFAGYAGDGGPAVKARLYLPSFLALDLSGNLFITDVGNHNVRKVDAQTGIITTVAGNGSAGYSGDGGPGAAAQLNEPAGIAVDTEGNLYIADSRNHVVRKVSAATGIISTVVGSGRHSGTVRGGPPLSVDIDTPRSLVFDASGALYIGASNGNAIKFDPARNNVANMIGLPFGTDPVFDPDGNLYFLQNSSLIRVSRRAKALGFGSTAVGASRGEALTFTNTGNAELHIQKIAAEGVNSGDFQIDNRCPSAIAPGDSCTISVVFAPHGIQPTIREAELVIYDETSGSPYRSALRGSAYALQTPSRTGWGQTYTFYAPVGKHARRSIPIQNLAAVPLTITGIQITGAEADQFQASTDCGFTVDPLRTCTVTVEFTPRAATIADATLTVTHNALGDPLTAGLRGNGRLQNLAATLRGTDADGDGRADLTVWRPWNGIWFTKSNSDPQDWTWAQWGAPTDIPVNGDFDGDGKTDMAVWRPETGVWYMLPSSNPGTWTSRQWGAPTDIPVSGDFDGDGKTDVAVWRPETGVWYILPSSRPQEWISMQWGWQGDVPVIGDFDGDGKTDIAVWRPSDGTWYVIPSSNPQNRMARQWGTQGDVPVAGDYDGDGKTDFAVWRPWIGTWFVILSSQGGVGPLAWIQRQWGTAGDIPVVRDMDGDGVTDYTVWRPSDGTWYVRPNGSLPAYSVQWGTAGDRPM